MVGLGRALARSRQTRKEEEDGADRSARLRPGSARARLASIELTLQAAER